MSMYDKNHYNIVISLQLIKINEKKKKSSMMGTDSPWTHLGETGLK